MASLNSTGAIVLVALISATGGVIAGATSPLIDHCLKSFTGHKSSFFDSGLFGDGVRPKIFIFRRDGVTSYPEVGLKVTSTEDTTKSDDTTEYDQSRNKDSLWRFRIQIEATDYTIINLRQVSLKDSSATYDLPEIGCQVRLSYQDSQYLKERGLGAALVEFSDLNDSKCQY